MSEDVQSPMEDAAAALVRADPAWQPEADAIMAGVDAMIGMQARLDAALAVVAELREEADAHETRQEAGGYPEAAAPVTRGVARALRSSADRIERALLGSDS